MKLRRFGAIFRKETLHIVRDWRSLTMAIVLPCILLLLFGYALTLDVDRVPTLILDLDRTPQSRALIARFDGSRYFSVRTALSFDEIQRGINDNSVLLGVTIPQDFSEALEANREAQVQLVLDGSDSNTASIASSYAEAMVQAYSAELRDAAVARAGTPKVKAPVEGKVRILYNDELKSKNFIVPGLIAVILMMISSFLTSTTVAREWESGSMEQLMSTPVRPAEFLLGKLCAYFVLGMLDMGISLVLGVGVFGVPLRGSVALLMASSCIFLFGALCWGILLSTVTRSQLLAFQTSLLSSFLPAFLLSGFLFSIDNMPWAIQQVTRLIPARYFVTLLQGVFLKGTGLEILWPPLLFLVVYALVVFAVAARKLRQKLA